MKPILLLLLVIVALQAGCSRTRTPPDWLIRAPLCEKAQHRITDVKRFTFELPWLFKQAPCDGYGYPDYGYNKRSDRLNVVLPGVTANKKVMQIGGRYSMEIHGNKNGFKYGLGESPEAFAYAYAERRALRRVDRIYADAKRVALYQNLPIEPVEWVSTHGFRCARFVTEYQNHVARVHSVEYFCWEKQTGLSIPFRIEATQTTEVDSMTLTDLDQVLIEPVLASIQLTLPSPEYLAEVEALAEQKCARVKQEYDIRKRHLGVFVDGRRTIRFLRGCGYTVADPLGIAHEDEILMPNGQLIGEGTDQLRRVTPAQFDALRDTFLSLRPELQESRPKQHVQGVGGKTWCRYKEGYKGDWYYLLSAGEFGLDETPVTGREIHIRMKKYDPCLKIVEMK